jgi:hypothetical protein
MPESSKLSTPTEKIVTEDPTRLNKSLKQIGDKFFPEVVARG